VPPATQRPDRGWCIGVAFLALQAVWVLASQFRESRDFSWAPHTVQVRYAISVHQDGRPLAPHEVARRYGIPAVGWEAHSHHNLFDLIEQAEATRGERDVRVRVEYHINEGEPLLWRGP
jgi:hypothetical protein